jgi:hypothetical protein
MKRICHLFRLCLHKQSLLFLNNRQKLAMARDATARKQVVLLKLSALRAVSQVTVYNATNAVHLFLFSLLESP